VTDERGWSTRMTRSLFREKKGLEVTKKILQNNQGHLWSNQEPSECKREVNPPHTCNIFWGLQRDSYQHYSHALHNDVSVNDGPHIRRWSHNIIILTTV